MSELEDVAAETSKEGTRRGKPQERGNGAFKGCGTIAKKCNVRAMEKERKNRGNI